MKTFASATLVTALLLALPAPAFALATETFGNAPMVNQPDWAVGIIDVVNLKSRVYSFWVNGNETFFYRGNAQDLTEALQKYAAVKDDLRRLILLPGPYKTQSFDRKPIPFDWQLNVPGGIYKVVSKRKHPVMTVYVGALKPRPLDRKQVEQWLRDLTSESFKTREQATQELRKLGQDAKPFLREALKAVPSPSLEARLRIEALLEKVRDLDVTDLEIPKGIAVLSVDEMVAAGLEELQDPEYMVRALAIHDLCSLAPYSDRVVPALADRLKNDKHAHVRRMAAICLESLGAQAMPATAALKQGLNDPDTNIRDACLLALAAIANAKDDPGQLAELKKKRAILKEINEFKKK
jgi:hypothetical protein